MNRQLLLAGAAALSLALAACGQKTDETEAVAPEAVPPAAMPTPVAAAEAAPDFVAKAAAGDMFQIEAGKVALQRSTNAQVKEFAQMMIDGHKQTTADLKSAIAASGLSIAPPTTLPADKASALADLRAVEAKDFDKAYIDGQIAVHEASLDLVGRYAQGGDSPPIKAAAGTLVPIVEQHLDRAKVIRAALK